MLEDAQRIALNEELALMVCAYVIPTGQGMDVMCLLVLLTVVAMGSVQVQDATVTQVLKVLSNISHFCNKLSW